MKRMTFVRSGAFVLATIETAELPEVTP